ncbi:hypothetical protein NE857_09855 [Nocardiopsis exhalans]|uniref:PD(D/E)XK endonuclease domain-containing protein n=1 Tax=Nocardiopsis exhalans TaxID=163604 RepID=A0ABY5DET7_9ACTN|nr:hypothetical protein [Nocardiopsis exhalans]USY21880.1 hypothetical protein NE857_09855 [Nocardiopsis exhalans]
MGSHLGRLVVNRRSGDEPIMVGDQAAGSLQAFWSWAYSDLADNTARGILAEYLVATALNAADGTRREWDSVDIRTTEEWRVEVKSSAYLQTWDQKELSKISFSIGPSAGWDARTNTQDTEKRRNSDAYVFCVLHHQDKPSLDPLDLGQWTFYVLPTRVLDEQRPEQQTIALSSLLELGPAQTDYPGLAAAVASAVEDHRRGTGNPQEDSASSGA